jgi:ATP-binding protein involved in chromosome partitioning
LDADIYGPNQPVLLGCDDASMVVKEGRMQPVMSHGVATMSMQHLLAGKDDPVVWRGPMASKALLQMMQGTDWGALDYLIVDLPPGTGDVQLTLVQKLPLTAAVMVTTPQTLACLDTAKGIAMFQSLDIPVLGVIENMASVTCSACGHVEHPFGEHGGAALAKHYQIPLLGQLPLEADLAGCQDVASWLAAAQRLCYAQCAQSVSFYSAALPKYRAPLMPPVVVDSGRK